MLVALITSFHGSQISWEDAVLFSLAGALVYPDQILEWMSAKTGRVFGWLHLIAFESAVAGLMTLAMFLMMPLSPTLVWREPFLITGLLAAIRLGVFLIMNIFGLDD